MIVRYGSITAPAAGGLPLSARPEARWPSPWRATFAPQTQIAETTANNGNITNAA